MGTDVESVLGAMRLSQSNRFFFYQWDSAPPIPAEAIVTQASNNHIIAANADVAHAVKSLRTGQIVQMEGWLVDAIRAERIQVEHFTAA